MRIHQLLCVSVFLFLGSISFANEYQIGDIVILHNSAINRRGVITDLSPTRGIKVSFVSEGAIHSSYIEDLRSLSLYKSAHSITVKTDGGQGAYTLNLSEKVLYKNQLLSLEAKVRDLTQDGMVLLEFANPIYNTYFGGYHRAAIYVRPLPKDERVIRDLKKEMLR